MCEQGSTPTFSPSSTGARQIVQSKCSSSSLCFNSSTSIISCSHVSKCLFGTSGSSDSEPSSMASSSHEAIVSGVDTLSFFVDFFVGVEGASPAYSPSSFSTFAFSNLAFSLLFSSCLALKFLVCKTYSVGRGVCKIPNDSACAIHRRIASSPAVIPSLFGTLIPLALSKYLPRPSANLAILSLFSISLCTILSNRLSFILHLGHSLDNMYCRTCLPLSVAIRNTASAKYQNTITGHAFRIKTV